MKLYTCEHGIELHQDFEKFYAWTKEHHNFKFVEKANSKPKGNIEIVFDDNEFLTEDGIGLYLVSEDAEFKIKEEEE